MNSFNVFQLNFFSGEGYSINQQNSHFFITMSWQYFSLVKVTLIYNCFWQCTQMHFLYLQKQSSRGVLCKKGVLRNFAKFTGNTCARVSFLIKLKASRPFCFPLNFAKFPRTCFFTEHLWWLLLYLFVVKPTIILCFLHFKC